jgi:predicted small secreted protein
MKRIVLSSLLGASMLAACNPVASSGSESATADAVSAGQEEVKQLVVDQAAANDACDLYIKALYTGADVVPTETCLAGIDQDGTKMLTSNDRYLRAVDVRAGDTFVPTADLLWHRAVPDDTTSTWSNFGAVFISLSKEPLCMDVETLAEDAAADTLFVLRPQDEEPVKLGVPIDAENTQVTAFPEPVSAGNSASAFTVFAREPRTKLKFIQFRSCE